MGEYQIEIRLSGYAREHIRRLLYSTARRFKIKGISKNHLIPCINIYGPFRTYHPKKMVETIVEVTKKYGLVSYRIKGFKHYEVERKWLIFNQGMRGIYLEIEPSSKLIELRDELTQRLDIICETQPFDIQKFHAMVEFGDIEKRFDRILTYLKENDVEDISQRLIRLTVLKNHRVICEYDLVQKRLLKRMHIRERKSIRKTISKIRQTDSESLKPIWLMAREIASVKRKSRQITLVENNPALRLPRILVSKRAKTRKPMKFKGKLRQITLVEDDPRLRIPRIFLLKFPKAKRGTKAKKKTRQLTLTKTGTKSKVHILLKPRIQKLFSHWQ